MKVVVVHLARLAATLLALYSLALVGSLLISPPSLSADEPLDVARAGSSLYLTEPKYVFMRRSSLNTSSDKILVLGASNAMVGFKRSELQQLMPGRQVHNIAVSGSNITQLGQVVDLVAEVQTPEARRHNTFVLGLWYGIFASDAARWSTPDRHAGDTDIDIERYRYGFYRRGASGAVPLLPPRFLRAGVTLVHPYLVVDQLARDMTQSLRGKLSNKAPKLSDAERNARVVSPAERASYLAFWRNYMGGVDALADAPFAELTRVVDRILADGGKVVLVDMPIPHWHAQGSALHANYERRMSELLPKLALRSGVEVVRLEDDDDDDFSDEVHPKPRVTQAWAQRLANASLLASTEGNTDEYRSPLRQADAGFSRRVR